MRLDDFKRHPWLGIVRTEWHVPARLLSLLVLLLLVNVLGFRHYSRWDLTDDKRFTLSGVTKSLASSLKREVDLVVLFLPSSEINDDLRTIVDEYRRAAGTKIRVEWLDPARQPDRTEEIKARYKVSLTGSSVIVARGERRRVLREEDLVQRDETGLINKFNGEIAISAALTEVLEETPRKLLLVSGHNPVPDLQASADEFRIPGARQNVKLDFVSLATGPVPEDANVLVIAAPQTDFSEVEMAELDRYWKRGRGSLFLVLDPDRPMPRLKGFVRALGAAPRGDRLVFTQPRHGEADAKIFSVVASIRQGSLITRDFAGMTLSLGGRSESIELFPDADLIRAQNIHLTPLLVADPRYWGETNFDAEILRRDRREDHHAPLYLAASIEKGAVDDPNLRVDTQRVVLVTSPGILRGGLDRDATQSDFLMSCVNWLLDRTHLIGIMPKEPARYAVSLTPQQRSQLERLLLWTGPGLAVIAAFGVGWWRRK